MCTDQARLSEIAVKTKKPIRLRIGINMLADFRLIVRQGSKLV